jgi:8-oxo-dGTP pyrophosphatase MutT (NUDIX family)
VIEISAGCVLIDRFGDEPRALLIRVRAHGYELPKGHLEAGETPEQAALRELREETGIESAVEVGAEVGMIEYSFPGEGRWIRKQVRFFAAACTELPRFGDRPPRTHDLRWVMRAELADVHLVSGNLRPIIEKALTQP